MPQLDLSDFARKVSSVMPLISREFFRSMSDEFYKTKLTMPQFAIMDVMSRNPDVKMSDLAHLISVTTAAMTGMIDRLVKGGYVSRGRDPDDRRIIKVRLTSKGSKIVKDMIDHRNKMTERIFGMLSENERAQYLKILDRIRRNLAGNTEK